MPEPYIPCAVHAKDRPAKAHVDWCLKCIAANVARERGISARPLDADGVATLP